MSAVLPLSVRELEFLEHLNDAGEIVPTLLSDDSAEQDVIQSHPGLLWKAQNEKKHVAKTAKRTT